MRVPRLSVLHLVLSIGETNAAYNEHCLPAADARKISVCTYFRATVTPPTTIALFAGDGSLAGFRRALASALAGGPYDVVHAHSPHVAVLFLLYALLSGRPGLLSSAVVTVHDSYHNYKVRNRLLFLPVFACFRFIVCCGRASFDSVPAFYRWLAGRRLRAVANGLDIARVDRTAAGARHPQQAHRDFTVLAVGRLVAIKNPFIAIAAVRRAAGGAPRLVYIGDGPLRDELVATCRDAGLDGVVRFTGLLPREAVFRHLLEADVFISCSRGEGLPVAVLEAMACRCPVVLSDIPPHREIAAGASFIPLVAPDDEAGFATAIQAMRAMTPAERTQAGEACRSLVEARFSLPAMHARYERLYREVPLSGRAPLVPSSGVEC